MERNEEQRVHGQHRAEEAHRQRVLRIVSHQRRGKRHEGLEHQKDRVQPHQRIVGVARQAEHVMVVQPELADDEKLMNQLAGASGPQERGGILAARRIAPRAYAARPVPAPLIHLAISVAVAPMCSSDRIVRSSETERSPASILATRD